MSERPVFKVWRGGSEEGYMEHLRERYADENDPNRGIRARALFFEMLSEAKEKELSETRRELNRVYKLALKKRAAPRKEAEAQAIEDARITGGMCPCCATRPLFDEGRRIGEIDHFYKVGDASIEAIWLICKYCNRRHIPPLIKSAYFAAHKHRVAESSPRQNLLL